MTQSCAGIFPNNSVAALQRLRSMVHEIVGRINGRYGTLTENPIHHLDRQLSFHEVRASTGLFADTLCVLAAYIVERDVPPADCRPLIYSCAAANTVVYCLTANAIGTSSRLVLSTRTSCSNSVSLAMQLCALYAVTDVALVTSLRDGMNLVSYEYVACQSENAGVLQQWLSERDVNAERMRVVCQSATLSARSLRSEID